MIGPKPELTQLQSQLMPLEGFSKGGLMLNHPRQASGGPK